MKNFCFKYKIFNNEVHKLEVIVNTEFFRYYNSWIETSDDPLHSDTSSSCTPSSKPSSSPMTNYQPDRELIPYIKRKHSLDMYDDIEKLALQIPVNSAEWSLHHSFNSTEHLNSDSTDEDEDRVFGTSFLWVPKKSWFNFYSDLQFF